ncbi:hypothetical protein DPEC_G00304900 [Dallia pectoralis]|uniref:Uncharacterized protein n=1 Tax=Dallia pectoralis TaxID=75939 RepID=A0ACC2FDP4_DALPE|nr:hypothetical protein DPEC_G00304900 [Dallia pectoralis]
MHCSLTTTSILLSFFPPMQVNTTRCPLRKGRTLSSVFINFNTLWSYRLKTIFLWLWTSQRDILSEKTLSDTGVRLSNGNRSCVHSPLLHNVLRKPSHPRSISTKDLLVL